MKQSCHGSMTESCEPRLKPSTGDREPVLRKLYIDLCNLIVESRIPGINERGYGEGIHCPPFLGPNSHCCDLSVPECQKHQKLMHRLLRSMKRNIFEVEVFLLPDCCVETKLTERIPKKEYVLLERWSFNCFHGNKIQSSIDIAQLLRAVRSFLYFSQISAWLSASQGKTPSNIYYWVRPSAEISTAKFENEPELHKFPLCKIYEGLYGTIEVRYRTRTQYVPIIPCSKHPPQENPLITVIDESDVCQTICIGTHLVKQLHKTCDTSHGSSISEKSVTERETIPYVLTPSNTASTPTKTLSGEIQDSITKSKGILKHSNCQTYSESVLGKVSNISQDLDQSNIIPNLMCQAGNKINDFYIRNPSQKCTSVKKHNLSYPIKDAEGKQRSISLDSSGSLGTDSGFSSLHSLTTSYPKQRIICNSSKHTLFKHWKLCSQSGHSKDKILRQSSPFKLSKLNVYDTTHSKTDTVKHKIFKSAQISKFTKSSALSSHLLQETSFSKSDISVESICSKNSLIISDSAGANQGENRWCPESSPISSKIIISKCEPLMPQEKCVPKGNETLRQCGKRKSSRKNRNVASSTATKCKSRLSGENVDLKGKKSRIDSQRNNFCHTQSAYDAEESYSSISVLHSVCKKTKVLEGRRKRKCCETVLNFKNAEYVTKSFLPIFNAMSDDKNSLENFNSAPQNEADRNTKVPRISMKRKLFRPMNHALESTKIPRITSINFDTKNSVSSPKIHVKSRKRKLNKITQNFNTDQSVSSFLEDPEPVVESSITPNILSIANLKHRSSSSNVQKKRIYVKKVRKKIIKEKNIQLCLNAVTIDKNTSQHCVTTREIDAMDTSLPISSSTKINLVDINNKLSNTMNQIVYPMPSETSFTTKVQFPSGTTSKNEKNTHFGASNKQNCDSLAKQTELQIPCITPCLLYTVQNIQSTALDPKLHETIASFPNHIANFRTRRRLHLNFEESILGGCLQPVSKVAGFKAEIGASGSFCPDHLTLPANVSFYELGSPHQSAAPYMAQVVLGEIEYFLPKKGALQVTLFNPSNTVVKMFVLNYDLSNMPPMCHTFIRQKTYYMPVGATEKDPSIPKWLRYVIHLRFASSKTGRIFLHKDFKIVVLNKSNDDAASDHIQEPRELRSFLSVPKNPTFSSL